MARKRVEEDVDLDEVDSFNANREKIMLDEAGEYANQQYSDESSEEEVMGVDQESDSEDEQDDEEEEELDEEDEEELEDEEKGWGGKKAYYGGDEVSDDEDMTQMTEEAMRQQKKHLNELAMDDYIDEDMMEDWQKTAETYEEKPLQITSETSIDKMDKSEQENLLKHSFPEFTPLLKELNQLKPKLESLLSREQNPLIEIKSVALSAYLGAISSYFGIFVDNLKNGGQFTMKDDPIMESILSSREVWRQANELPEELKEVAEDISEVSSDDEEQFVDAKENYSEEEEDNEVEEEDVEEEEEEDSFGIDVTKQRNIKRASKHTSDDFAESAEIEDVDLEDKTRRKKTLRFYTSKIDQASLKNNKTFSGDMDIPYKERLFERQQRLVEEARKRGLTKTESGEESGDDQEPEQDDHYYDSIKQGKINKKVSRKSAHEAAVKAAKEGKLAELQEQVGTNGKRAINYQILKNKGLTPHRKKEYRNSRVKKRKQYETAKKKLKSVRQVYDSNRGPYEGEKTGIKKGLSRSVKLV
ncbi:putative silencing protein [Spathaspora sp. JA1]|nr:putative silencing protein [Spathaspora sp. JA1]